MSQSAVKRLYDDGCAVAQILDVIGERWALLIMREMVFGPKRFRDIRASLPGISANVLTQRLESLEAAGIVQRRLLPPPSGVQVYELTEWGHESEILFRVIGRWAARSPKLQPKQMSVASVILSMRTMFSSDAAGAMKATIGFRFGHDAFVADIHDGLFAIDRGDPAQADIVFSGDQNGLVAALYGGVPLDVLEADGALAIAGDRALAECFTALFPLPPRAAAPL